MRFMKEISMSGYHVKLIFQFSLWDSDTITFTDQQHQNHFQFSLWDSFGWVILFTSSIGTFFQFSLWDSAPQRRTYAYKNWLSILFMRFKHVPHTRGFEVKCILSILFMRFKDIPEDLMTDFINFQFSLWDSPHRMLLFPLEAWTLSILFMRFEA